MVEMAATLTALTPPETAMVFFRAAQLAQAPALGAGAAAAALRPALLERLQRQLDEFHLAELALLFQALVLWRNRSDSPTPLELRKTTGVP